MSTISAGLSRSRSISWRVLSLVLQPCEHDELVGHFLRLDDASRSARFGRAVNDAWAERYVAETDWQRGAVLGCWIDGTLRGVAELRCCDSDGSETAEMAVSVEPPFQNHGLGSLLARRGVAIACKLGFVRLCMLIAIGNWPMRSIAQKLGARMTFADGAIKANLPLEPSASGRGQPSLDADNWSILGLRI